MDLLKHQIVWSGIEADGTTTRVRCACGFEGTLLEYYDHTGQRPWTKEEIERYLDVPR